MSSIKVIRFITYEESELLNEKDDRGFSGGFFQRGMRWKDYLDHFTYAIEGIEVRMGLLREAIIKEEIRCSGNQHQSNDVHSVPVFNDGTHMTFTYRAWGDLMAAVWSEKENEDYSYMDFYC